VMCRKLLMCKKEFEAHKASFVENMMIFTK